MTAPENQTILRKNSYEGENFPFSICHIDYAKVATDMTARRKSNKSPKNSYEGEIFCFSICHIDNTKGHNRYDSTPKIKQFSEKFLIREKFFVFQSVILIIPKVTTDMTAY